MHLMNSTQPSLALGFGGHVCHWGGHFCGLYETEKERDEIVMGFLHQGDLDGDLQLYCPVERTPADFTQTYALAYGECAGHLDDPQRFRVMPAREVYYPDGVFSPRAMDASLGRFYEESQRHGPRNIRATAEMLWALEAIPGVEDLMVYESRLNYFIPGKPWISICMYNVREFSGAVIMNALRTHPYTINKGLITENPYYEPPERWLAANAPDYLGKSPNDR